MCHDYCAPLPCFSGCRRETCKESCCNTLLLESKVPSSAAGYIVPWNNDNGSLSLESCPPDNTKDVKYTLFMNTININIITIIPFKEN